MAQLPRRATSRSAAHHASFGVGGGLGLPIIAKLLGRSQLSTTQRYGHLDADPVRRASALIRVIEVRRCPWQWVVFRNVPLVPNAEARKNGGRPIVKRRVLHEGAGRPDTIVYDVVGVQK